MDTTKWTTVIEPCLMETHLIKYHRLHFQQVQGSLYTVPLLSDLLNYNSLTPFGAQVLCGTADLETLDLSPHTKLLIQHQCTWLLDTHPQLQPFPFEVMLEGFHKWLERTSTSPLG